MDWFPREVISSNSLSLREHQEAIISSTLTSIWRRRWLIVGLLALSLLVGFSYIRGIESKYTSETIIQLDFMGDTLIGLPASASGAALDPRAIIESDTRIIGSLSMARRVVSRLDLVNDPDFASQPNLLVRLLALTGTKPLPQSLPHPSEVAAIQLLENLSVASDRQSYLISIKYTSTDAEKAALIANTFAAEYLLERSHASFERATRSYLWLAAQVASARAALTSIEQATIAESNTVDVRARQARLSSLEAEANSIRERLKVLDDSMQKVRALKELKPASARVAVQALPSTIPSGPNRTIALGVIAAAAGVFSVMLTLLLERRDTGFRTSAEVTPATDKPCLGEIPEVSRTALSVQKTILSVAIHDAATAAGLYALTRDHKVIIITSALPNEGKSFFADHLAQSLAAAGQRVLSIDTSPSRAHDDTAIAPTLELAIAESSERARLFAEEQQGGISFLRRSTGIIAGQQIYNSEAFQDFINEARHHYNVIILEAPPVLLLVDSWLVKTPADNVILVARWNTTPRGTIKAALCRLSDLSIHVKGVLLSRVQIKLRNSYPLADRPYFRKKYRKYYNQLS